MSPLDLLRARRKEMQSEADRQQCHIEGFDMAIAIVEQAECEQAVEAWVPAIGLTT